MKRQLPFILIGVLLAACAAGVFLTRGPASNRPENKKAAVQTIDSRLLDTARALSTEADTADDEAAAPTKRLQRRPQCGVTLTTCPCERTCVTR